MKAFYRSGLLGGVSTYQYYSLSHAKQFLPPNPSIVDAGCHKGMWTLLARRVLGPGKYHMIDPQNLRTPLHRAVTFFAHFHQFAIAQKSGEMTLNHSPRSDSSSLLPTQGFEWETVKTLRLDEMISEGKIPTPDLLKIDAEGFDHDVLVSLGEHIRSLSALIFELPVDKSAHDSLKKLSVFCKAQGLTLSSIWPATSSQDRCPKMDALFIKES